MKLARACSGRGCPKLGGGSLGNIYRMLHSVSGLAEEFIAAVSLCPEISVERSGLVINCFRQ
jgi:hypothetical protein